MKKIYLLVGLIGLLTSCHDVPESDKTTAAETQAAATMRGRPYQVDTGLSRITWVGTKVNGRHSGRIRFAEGKVGVEDGHINGGVFVINIASLENEDLPPREKIKIENHLKSADFFDVKNYPTARFEISRVEPFDSTKTSSVLTKATHTVSGNLTLKGVTKNVSFPARVAIEQEKLSVYADFSINRTDWGMNYKGANNPQDWLINKEVNLKLDVVARR